MNKKIINWKSVWRFLKRLTIYYHITQVSLLSFYPKSSTPYCRDICTSMFIMSSLIWPYVSESQKPVCSFVFCDGKGVQRTTLHIYLRHPEKDFLPFLSSVLNICDYWRDISIKIRKIKWQIRLSFYFSLPTVYTQESASKENFVFYPVPVLITLLQSEWPSPW